jgi:16S rRNA (cytidine1402-2'-O)-methyltransferase
MDHEPPQPGSKSPGPPETRGGDPASKLASGLYLVATPIGNLGDIAARAIQVLGSVDTVLCEDTRHSGRLMAALGLKVQLRPYHEHNAARVRPGLIEALGRGARLALISDAGMPAIADPGHKLVREAIDAGIMVTAVPGPSAVLMALAVSGLPTDRFLPAKPGARQKVLAELARIPATLILFESPHRLARSLADAAATLGPRQAAIARELTKLHEEIRRGTLDALATTLAAEPPPKGEIVLVIGPPTADETTIDPATLETLLQAALADRTPSRAAALVADQTGHPRAELYKLAVALRGKA